MNSVDLEIISTALKESRIHLTQFLKYSNQMQKIGKGCTISSEYDTQHLLQFVSEAIEVIKREFPEKQRKENTNA